ncbi:MAG TPA: hypothetical protein VJ508_08365, partial [Saprospiraceae bacterium]|nr:hypothetical protein [Saprospiraceae bacterium]
VSNGQTTSASSEKTYVDVVWLRDGSRLVGTITKWELARGIEFKLATGASVVIPKSDIRKVYQHISGEQDYSPVTEPRSREPLPYSFKEKGVYNSFSGFLNLSDIGGAGLAYSIGYRFNRLLGTGVGVALETNDMINNRDVIPVFAEARGFFMPEKISPYYALKLGYGIAVKKQNSLDVNARGGFYFSPELGVRFGGRLVNYYLGMEYKLQRATFVSDFGWETTATDRITYKRFELRTGLLF